jgi:hypothetical protein
MRVLLYRNLEPAFSPQALAGVSPPDAEKFAPLIEQVRRENREATSEIRWSSDAASGEIFHAIPLDGRDRRPLGVLLIGSSRSQVVALMHSIRNVGLSVGAAGILLALALACLPRARTVGACERTRRGRAKSRAETGMREWRSIRATKSATWRAPSR